MSLQAMSWALGLRGHTPSEKLLLLALSNYADAKGKCWPSHRTLSDDTGLSQRTVLTLLKGLTEKRLIKRDARTRPGNKGRTSDVITLLMGGETISPGAAKGGEIISGGVGKLTAKGGEMVSPLEPIGTVSLKRASARGLDEQPSPTRLGKEERAEMARMLRETAASIAPHPVRRRA